MIIAIALPAWPEGGRATDLLTAVLAIAPRVTAGPSERLLWIDGRGLDAAALAADVVALCQRMIEQPSSPPRAGVATVPIVAAIAARQTLQEVMVIPPGRERRYLAALPLAVLTPPPALVRALGSVGLSRCGELAALEREAVEVRFGAEGVACWRLARADDRRLLFRQPPRERHVSSLDWTDFSTPDLEQLVFVIHAMLGTVCDQLAGEGLGATRLSVELTLEGGGRLHRTIGSSRPTRQRLTWLRLIRRDFERVTLPDRVSGVALYVEATAPPQVRQGDLFDHGFASAEAADAALARILDLQADALVRPIRSEHPLPECRVRWVADLPAADGGRSTALPDRPMLHLRLPPAPAPIRVTTRLLRDGVVPLSYRDDDHSYQVMRATLPSRVAVEGIAGTTVHEYHQILRDDGAPVLLCYDEIAATWRLAGWWQ